MAEDNVIFIGKKRTMSYVTAVVTQFKMNDEAGKKEKVTIKARGKTIGTAVDVAEVVRNKFLPVEVDDIKIGTESLVNKEGRNSNVSYIEIVLKKK